MLAFDIVDDIVADDVVVGRRLLSGTINNEEVVVKVEYAGVSTGGS